MKTLCKVCGSDITECHCIEPGTLHRRNPLPSTIKEEITIFSNKKCLSCCRVLGSDCNVKNPYIEDCTGVYKPLKPINGKKKR